MHEELTILASLASIRSLEGTSNWGYYEYEYEYEFVGFGTSKYNIDGLVQERRNSSMSVMEFDLSCIDPSIYS